MSFAKHVLAALSVAISLGFLVMWPVGCWSYTTVGIDRDRRDGAGVWHDFYRVQWPGDGSVYIGGSGYREPRLTHPLEPFDLGGAFFEPPRRRPPGPKPRHTYKEWHGFSWEAYDVPTAWKAFLGMPAALPIPLFALPPILWWLRRRAVMPPRRVRLLEV